MEMNGTMKRLSTDQEIKEAMLMACKIMDTFGLIQGFGHVTSRLPNTTNILVTPKKPPGLAREEELVIVDLQGKKVKKVVVPENALIGWDEIAKYLGWTKGKTLSRRQELKKYGIEE
jgi:hypothetical protein